MQQGGSSGNPQNPAGTGDPNPTTTPPTTQPGQGDPGSGAGSGGNDPPSGQVPPTGGSTGSGDSAGGEAKALEAARKGEKEALARERETKKALEAAELKLKAAADAEKSELERAQEAQKKAEEDLKTERANRQRLALRYAVARYATAANFENPEDALGFIDLDQIEFDEAGEPKGVEELVKQLAKDKPYLLKQATGKQPPPSTTPSSRNVDGKTLTAEQEKANRDEARKQVGTFF